MSQLKKHQVVLLPTEKASLLYRIHSRADSKIVLGYGQDTTKDLSLKPQHLYILSDDEIKEGDWYIHNQSGTLRASNSNAIPMDAKKIVATTDFELNKGWIKDNDPERLSTHTNIVTMRGIAQPSESFIKKYIKMYNAGTPITDVMVEYENFKTNNHLYPHKSNREYDNNWLLKVAPDNTITIRSVKDSWSREEVKSLLLQLVKDCGKDDDLLSHYSGDYRDLNKWIEENT